MDKIFNVIHDVRLASGAFAYICCKKDQLIVKETASSKRKHENDDVDGAELTKKHRGETQPIALKYDRQVCRERDMIPFYMILILLYTQHV